MTEPAPAAIPAVTPGTYRLDPGRSTIRAESPSPPEPEVSR
jgi:hypothetical protein